MSNLVKSTKSIDLTGAMYRNGMCMMPSMRHPASVLHGCGWRTESQLRKAKERKENRTYNTWRKLEARKQFI